ncbi:hypothetical protein UPYG_G00086380 [Umbra pygmaea]|uniref:Uncharacterized protein n=1 Tax=Umbra pygmaea TaxID=75934 RepID=A0ABD0XES2_UMBPY
MRSQKQQAKNSTGMFLTPTVNSYKLHLNAVNSLIPARNVHRLLDCRWSKDFTKEMNVDTIKMNSPRQDSKLNAHSGGARPLHTPVPAFVSDYLAPEHAQLPPRPAVHSGLTDDLRPQPHRLKPRRATHSAGAICCHPNSPFSSPTEPGENVSLLERSAPGFPIAFRSHGDCALSPERLDLKSRSLEECPHLEGMDGLRLLNLQHNLIMHIHNLSHLRCLVFLDLYDNRISQMSGISSLASLRVLLMGKNRIQRICSLDNLTKLDVLDLHCNTISQIENMSHLSELRVLNLAGNRISTVNNLHGLHSLIELNLRRNCISTVVRGNEERGVQF